MFKTPFLLLAFSLLTSTCLISDQVFAADYLQLLDGTGAKVEIASIDSSGVVKLSGNNKTYELQGLRSIRHNIQHRGAVQKRASGITAEVFLAGGSIIMTQSMQYKDETFQLSWKASKPLEVDLSEVFAVKLVDGKIADSPIHQRALKQALANRGDKDQLLVRVKKTVQPIEGLLEDITAGHILLQRKGKTQKYERKKIYAIVMAKLDDPPNKIGSCQVELTDGSTVVGPLQKMEQGQVHIRYAKKSVTQVAWKDVYKIRIFSDRMVFLSDLKPQTAVHHAGLVSFKFPWQSDKNVKGGKLTFGKKTYDKGIGVHSYSLLKFEVDEKFNHFSAVIGLDTSIKGHGDCVFVVLAEGRELFRQRMRQSDAAKEINVSLGSASTISLVVEFGKQLDFADNANWCDARLLTKKTP